MCIVDVRYWSHAGCCGCDVNAIGRSIPPRGDIAFVLDRVSVVPLSLTGFLLHTGIPAGHMLLKRGEVWRKWIYWSTNLFNSPETYNRTQLLSFEPTSVRFHHCVQSDFPAKEMPQLRQICCQPPAHLWELICLWLFSFWSFSHLMSCRKDWRILS